MPRLSINPRKDIVQLSLNSVKLTVNLIERDIFPTSEDMSDSFPSSRLLYLRFDGSFRATT